MDNDPDDHAAGGMGHNQPPTETDELLKRLDELVANANRWRADRPVIVDQEMAGTAQRFIIQLRDIRGAMEKNLKEITKPHDEAIVAAKLRFRDPLALVGLALNGMALANTVWLQKQRDELEEQRRRAEAEAEEALAEAERLRQEAQKPGATVQDELAVARAEERVADITDRALSIPDRPRIKDDQAARAMSIRTFWKARVINQNLAIKSYKSNLEVKTAVRAAALAQITKIASNEARFSKNPADAKPGIEFYTDERAT